jgi:DNA-binding response OmpR family regulator
MKTILLVDDEILICSELKRVLGRHGFRVSCAHDLESALRLAERTPFDLVLVEFCLKSASRSGCRTCNGIEFLHRLRAARISAPVVMYSTMEGEPYESAALGGGADAFISKSAESFRADLLKRIA